MPNPQHPQPGCRGLEEFDVGPEDASFMGKLMFVEEPLCWALLLGPDQQITLLDARSRSKAPFFGVLSKPLVLATTDEEEGRNPKKDIQGPGTLYQLQPCLTSSRLLYRRPFWKTAGPDRNCEPGYRGGAKLRLRRLPPRGPLARHSTPLGGPGI